MIFVKLNFKFKNLLISIPFMINVTMAVTIISIPHPKIFMEGTAVRKNIIKISITAAIKEFLRMVFCFPNPFNILFVAAAVYDMGADSAANRI